MRQTIDSGKTSYEPNRVSGGCPFQAGADMSGFKTAIEKLDGIKVRDRNLSFVDHFTQARLFFLSQTPTEKVHIIDAFVFELLHVTDDAIKERMIAVLQQVDERLAEEVAAGLGIASPVAVPSPINLQLPADTPESQYQPKSAAGMDVVVSRALSILDNPVPSVETLKVALLLAEGFDEKVVSAALEQFKKDGATPCIVAPNGGTVSGDKGYALKVDFALPATGSVLFDALFIGSSGKSAGLLIADAKAKTFVAETYKHCKPIGLLDGSQDLLLQSLAGLQIEINGNLKQEGIVVIDKQNSMREFEHILAQKRFHMRADVDKVMV